MSGVGIFLGVVALGVIAKTIWKSYSRDQKTDLGSVSDRWLAERRMDTRDSR